MMRVCHLDTCPVGVATQNPELRKKFTGKPEFVVNFFEFIAEEVREHLAALGLPHDRGGDRPRRGARHPAGRRPLEGVGPRPHADPARARVRRVRPGPFTCTQAQDHGLDRALDNTLIAAVRGRARATGTPVTLELPIRNVNRTVGTMLGYELTKRYGGDGPARRHDPDHASPARPARASARSCPRGITLRLEGDANDYFGKGLSGGAARRPPAARTSPFVAEENIIAGNVILYGATGGEVFIRGRRRRAVLRAQLRRDRGRRGRRRPRLRVHDRRPGRRARADRPQLRAGMSGGIAYVYDPDGAVPGAREPRDGRPRPARRRRRRVAARRSSAGTTSETGSAVAERILDRWRREVEHFAKVMPEGLQARARSGTRGRGARHRRGRGDHGGGAWVSRPGFMKYDRELPTRRPVPVRLRDWQEVYEPFPAEKLQTQAARCMDCGIPFCHTGCPLGNLIPEWNDLVYRDRLAATRSSACTPRTTSPSSPAGCARRRARRRACSASTSDPVTIKQVEVEIVDRGVGRGLGRRRSMPPTKTGKRVAVVGSGPGRARRRAAADAGRPRR